MSEVKDMLAKPQRAREHRTPPEALVRQVKQALDHLYDFPYLEGHPLVQEYGRETTRSGQTAGQSLRRDLVSAIESLNPGAGVPFHAPPARLHSLLQLHYVEGRTVQEAARELGLSLRQAHRDLRRGEDSVATMLWAQHSASLPQEPNATRLSSVQAEIARLESHPRATDVCALLQRAQAAVAQLARQRDVRFCAEIPLEPVMVSVDPAMAQQVLVNTLSHAAQQSLPGALYLTLTAIEECVCVALRYAPDPAETETSTVNDVVAQLAGRLKWQVRQEDPDRGVRVVTLHMITRGPVVLVVDDNEGLVELLDRYLTGHTCRVTAAASGEEGLRLTQELAPDAIVLDVMMPEMDGWEFLQRLRARPQTANTPVIICSVINDPELAYSLGASLFLPKPVSRDDVLEALRQLGIA